MSTCVGVEIDGLSVEDYQNHHRTWFFKPGDRVRENLEGHENGRLPDDAFIGFRASAASIRRRMMLAGYDLQSCERHFNENLRSVIEATEWVLQNDDDRRHADSEDKSVRVDAYRLFLDAVRNTSFQHWLTALPEAITLNKHVCQSGVFSGLPVWRVLSENPLVNAMLSDIPLYTEFSHTGLFNFPCSDSHFFQLALLTCCNDDAVCELNIAPLIQSGYEDDFRDLDEIQRQETYPHIFSRQSLEEIISLSASQADNPSLQRMCYASIITSMEAYLGDILRREIFARPAVKERFVASYEPFKKHKFNLTELYARLSVIDTDIKEVLDGLSLHKIDIAMNIFASTLLTEFPSSQLPFIHRAVKLRHHIVHRNGRDEDGTLLSFNHETVSRLAQEVLAFTRAVDAQILDGLVIDDELTGNDLNQ
ncbi:hypothetical protein G5574_23340 (plasmid) [Pantoea stewartii]|uniref:HEPN/Toprim-associated domain-containing protein n=1 Tax=Pantoea stewartii TaxID=66269 RepID=UPI0013DE3967|nr:HEPN/Toprim-associated domain-containing protein [Pantoea stewartii]QIE99920.1 hypothetical protein G5574_23340 [Pantoea stewartii]